VEFINAVSKVRFSSARAQRVLVHKGNKTLTELLCLEAGQEMKVAGGRWIYYIIAGCATVDAGGNKTPLAASHMAAASDEPHTIANAGEGRLICLAVGES
jgi:hypothetical protein